MWIMTRRDDFTGRPQNGTLWDLWELIAQVPDGRKVLTRLGEAELYGQLTGQVLGEAMRALTGELQNGNVGCVARLRNIGRSQTVDRDACATWRFIDGPAREEPRAVIDPVVGQRGVVGHSCGSAARKLLACGLPLSRSRSQGPKRVTQAAKPEYVRWRSSC